MGRRALHEVVGDRLVRTWIAAPEDDVRPADRLEQVAVGQPPEEAHRVGDRGRRIGRRGQDEGRVRRVDDRRGSRVGLRLGGPVQAGHVAVERRPEPEVVDPGRLPGVEPGVQPRRGVAEPGVERVVLALGRVVHRVGVGRVRDRLERLRVDDDRVVGGPRQRDVVAIGGGRQVAQELRAVERTVGIALRPRSRGRSGSASASRTSPWPSGSDSSAGRQPAWPPARRRRRGDPRRPCHAWQTVDARQAARVDRRTSSNALAPSV